MSDEFTVQCPKCGTRYNDLQEVCPYCGEPQPELTESGSVPHDLIVEQPPEQETISDPTVIPGAHEWVASQFVNEDADQSFFVDDDIFAIVGETDPVPEDIPTLRIDEESSWDAAPS